MSSASDLSCLSANESGCEARMKERKRMRSSNLQRLKENLKVVVESVLEIAKGQPLDLTRDEAKRRLQIIDTLKRLIEDHYVGGNICSPLKQKPRSDTSVKRSESSSSSVGGDRDGVRVPPSVPVRSKTLSRPQPAVTRRAEPCRSALPRTESTSSLQQPAASKGKPACPPAIASVSKPSPVDFVATDIFEHCPDLESLRTAFFNRYESLVESDGSNLCSHFKALVGGLVAFFRRDTMESLVDNYVCSFVLNEVLRERISVTAPSDESPSCLAGSLLNRGNVRRKNNEHKVQILFHCLALKYKTRSGDNCRERLLETLCEHVRALTFSHTIGGATHFLSKDVVSLFHHDIPRDLIAAHDEVIIPLPTPLKPFAGVEPTSDQGSPIDQKADKPTSTSSAQYPLDTNLATTTTTASQMCNRAKDGANKGPPLPSVASSVSTGPSTSMVAGTGAPIDGREIRKLRPARKPTERMMSYNSHRSMFGGSVNNLSYRSVTMNEKVSDKSSKVVEVRKSASSARQQHTLRRRPSAKRSLAKTFNQSSDSAPVGMRNERHQVVQTCNSNALKLKIARSPVVNSGFRSKKRRKIELVGETPETHESRYRRPVVKNGLFVNDTPVKSDGNQSLSVIPDSTKKRSSTNRLLGPEDEGPGVSCDQPVEIGLSKLVLNKVGGRRNEWKVSPTGSDTPVSPTPTFDDPKDEPADAETVGLILEQKVGVMSRELSRLSNPNDQYEVPLEKRIIPVRLRSSVKQERPVVPRDVMSVSSNPDRVRKNLFLRSYSTVETSAASSSKEPFLQTPPGVGAAERTSRAEDDNSTTSKEKQPKSSTSIPLARFMSMPNEPLAKLKVTRTSSADSDCSLASTTSSRPFRKVSSKVFSIPTEALAMYKGEMDKIATAAPKKPFLFYGRASVAQKKCLFDREAYDVQVSPVSKRDAPGKTDRPVYRYKKGATSRRSTIHSYSHVANYLLNVRNPDHLKPVKPSEVSSEVSQLPRCFFRTICRTKRPKAQKVTTNRVRNGGAAESSDVDVESRKVLDDTPEQLSASTSKDFSVLMAAEEASSCTTIQNSINEEPAEGKPPLVKRIKLTTIKTCLKDEPDSEQPAMLSTSSPQSVNDNIGSSSAVNNGCGGGGEESSTFPEEDLADGSSITIESREGGECGDSGEHQNSLLSGPEDATMSSADIPSQTSASFTLRPSTPEPSTDAALTPPIPDDGGDNTSPPEGGPPCQPTASSDNTISAEDMEAALGGEEFGGKETAPQGFSLLTQSPIIAGLPKKRICR